MTQTLIKAKMTGSLAIGRSKDFPVVEFNCVPALKELGADALRRTFEEDDLGPGFATDRLAQKAARYDEQVKHFFDMLNAAGEIGIDLGGYDVWVLDKKRYVQWLQENRPAVLEEIDEEWYNHHLT